MAPEAESRYGDPQLWRFHPLTGEPLTKGLSNFKLLFRKPSFSDWITLALLVLVIIGAFVYQSETKACRDTLANLDKVCTKYNYANADVGVSYPDTPSDNIVPDRAPTYDYQFGNKS